MKVSIVIPVYNEAERLGACLEAIARQTVRPHEVIVVDNNSSDATVALASAYPNVVVLRESRQGVVYARDHGFDAASGDIIGRLDADSQIDTDWVATLIELFEQSPDLDAVTGKVRYYGLAYSWLLDTIDLRIRRRMARLLGREVAMQGANMAVRLSAWQAVRRQLCRGGGMHEDYDLAIHLSKTGHTVVFDERLTAAIDCRRVEAGWLDFCAYAWLSPRTYAKHRLRSRYHMYPVVALVIAAYFPLKLLHRGYDISQQRFSWRQLLVEQTVTARVNPATFVD
jgi:glycosyltransferase involved in cell wall biosynthesis